MELPTAPRGRIIKNPQAKRLKAKQDNSDDLLKLVEAKLKIVEDLENLLEEGGQLQKVYAEAFRLSGLDYEADQLEKYNYNKLLANKESLAYIHDPLSNIKQLLEYVKGNYQLFTVEFVNDVFRYKAKNEETMKGAREILPSEALNNLDNAVALLLKEGRQP
jgi:hypothetical protein